MRPTFLILCFSLLSSLSYGQGEANIWYFGYNAGVDFNTNPPTVLEDSKMRTHEGCASIADSAGNLLFYTDGLNIWNRQHNIMDGGTGLLGNSSSTQSAVVVKHPLNDFYYVFTIDGHTGKKQGFNYCKVDMKLNGGLGKVTEKNTAVLPNTAEKIAAVVHSNQKDIWLVVRDMRTNNYYAYLLTQFGLSSAFVHSKVGVVVSVSYPGVGYLRASLDGKYIVNAEETEGLEIFQFNNTTGVLSNPIKISDKSFYGAEFSYSSKMLYASTLAGKYVFQYDVGSYNATSIISSEYLVARPARVGTMQLAPNGKIYLCNSGTDSLSAINNPEVKGAGCNYEGKAILLKTGRCRLGLPTFYGNYIYQSFNYTVHDVCFGNQNTFKLNTNNSKNIDSVRWDFDDPTSGLNNTSTLISPEHYYSSPGIYKPSVIIYYNATSSVKRDYQIEVYPPPSFSLGNDTALCAEDSIMINLSGIKADTIIWDGVVGKDLQYLKGEDTHIVEVIRKGCAFKDTMHIDTIPQPKIDLGGDLIFCSGDSTTLDATVIGTGVNYKWNDGITSPMRVIKNTGTYGVIVSRKGCKGNYDEVKLTFNPKPKLERVNDTLVCYKQPISIGVNSEWDKVEWRDGIIGNDRIIDNDGSYFYTAHYLNCSDSDTFVVSYYPPLPRLNAGADTNMCPPLTYLLDVKYEGFYKTTWQDGSEGRYFTATYPGYYVISINHQCGTVIDSMEIFCQGDLYIPNAFSPNADGKNDIFLPIGFNVEILYMKVFNRWGELLYDGTEGWDGTYKGVRVPIGSYVYMIGYKRRLEDGYNLIYKSGTVQVLN